MEQFRWVMEVKFDRCRSGITGSVRWNFVAILIQVIVVELIGSFGVPDPDSKWGWDSACTHCCAPDLGPPIGVCRVGAHLPIHSIPLFYPVRVPGYAWVTGSFGQFRTAYSVPPPGLFPFFPWFSFLD